MSVKVSLEFLSAETCKKNRERSQGTCCARGRWGFEKKHFTLRFFKIKIFYAVIKDDGGPGSMMAENFGACFLRRLLFTHEL